MKKKLIAKTKKGQEITIKPVFDENEDNVSYTAEFEGTVTKLSNANFGRVNSSGKPARNGKFFVVKLDSHKVQNLFGIEIPKDTTAAVKFTSDNAEKVIRKEWPKEHGRRITDTVEKEINSMNDDDPITLYAFSGYGMHYTLESEKLGYHASRRAAKRVEKIIDMLPSQPAPEKNSDVAYKVELTWGEYQDLLNRMDKEDRAKEDDRKEKFEKAKRTGKPVLLQRVTVDEEDLPYSEREKESSVAFVSVFAMPDGSTKQKISHAY